MQTTAKMLSGTINPYPEPTGNAQQRPDSNVRQGPSGRGRGSGRTNPSHRHRHTHTSSKTRHQRNTKSEDLNILSHAQGQLRSHLEPASTHSRSPYQDPAPSHAQPPPQQQQQYQQDPSWHGPRHPFAWPPQPLYPQQRGQTRPHSASDIITAPAVSPAAAHPWLPASTSASGTQAYPLPPASDLDATTEDDDLMDEDSVVQSIETEPLPHSYSFSHSQSYPKTSSPTEGRESWVRRAGLKRESGDVGGGERVGEGKKGRVGL